MGVLVQRLVCDYHTFCVRQIYKRLFVILLGQLLVLTKSLKHRILTLLQELNEIFSNKVFENIFSELTQLLVILLSLILAHKDQF